MLTRRLFFAIELPEVVQTSLHHLQSGLQRVSWSDFHQFHLTLKFIGERPEEQFDEIRNSVRAIQYEPFILEPEQVGFFPGKGQPQVLWAGLGTAHPLLFALQKSIDDALFAIGIEPEKRIYRPHITLGRCQNASRESIRQWVKAHQAYEGPPFQVDHFTLFSSRLGVSGAQYLKEEVYPLGHSKGSNE